MLKPIFSFIFTLVLSISCWATDCDGIFNELPNYLKTESSPPDLSYEGISPLSTGVYSVLDSNKNEFVLRLSLIHI